MINPNIVLVGVVLQSIGCFSYLIDTVKGKVQPNKVSWLMWSIAPLIAFVAEIQQHVGIQALSTFIVGFCPLVVFIASFANKKAKWELTKFDLTCGLLSVLGLILWLTTRVGNVAIFFSIMADGLAAVPTIVKSYNHPESENHLPYSTGVINALTGLLAISSWNFQSYGFPLYLLCSNSLITTLIIFRPQKKA